MRQLGLDTQWRVFTGLVTSLARHPVRVLAIVWRLFSLVVWGVRSVGSTPFWRCWYPCFIWVVQFGRACQKSQVCGRSQLTVVVRQAGDRCHKCLFGRVWCRLLTSHGAAPRWRWQQVVAIPYSNVYLARSQQRMAGYPIGW